MTNFLGPSNGSAFRDGAIGIFGPRVLFQNPFSDAVEGLQLTLRRTSTDQRRKINIQPDDSSSLNYVEVFMKTFGTPVGTITCELYQGTTLRATSVAVNVSTISSSDWMRVRFTFASPYTLSANVVYGLVFTGTYSISTSNYVSLAATAPVSGLAAEAYNGSSWTVTGDRSGCVDVFTEKTAITAQSFVASGDQKVDQVRLMLAKQNSPTGDIVAHIYDDLNGKPNQIIGSSHQIDASGLGTSYSWVTFPFATPVPLTDGERYHVALATLGTVSSSNNVLIGIAQAGVFSNGTVNRDRQTSGAWYTHASYDLIFEVYYVADSDPPTTGEVLADLGRAPANIRDLAGYVDQLVNRLSTYFPSPVPVQYGGTGVSKLAPGDILVASSENHLERLSPGAFGSVLSISPDGLPAWQRGGAELVTATFLNSSGTQIDIGDVVVHHTGVTQGVTLTTTKGDMKFAGIAAQIVPPGQYGTFVVSGLTRVRVSGTVNRGDVLAPTTVQRRAAKSGHLTGPIVALEDGSDGSLVLCHIDTSRNPPYFSHYFSWSGDIGTNNVFETVTFWAHGGTFLSGTLTTIIGSEPGRGGTTRLLLDGTLVASASHNGTDTSFIRPVLAVPSAGQHTLTFEFAVSNGGRVKGATYYIHEAPQVT